MPPPSLCPGGTRDMQKVAPAQSGGGLHPSLGVFLVGQGWFGEA